MCHSFFFLFFSIWPIFDTCFDRHTQVPHLNFLLFLSFFFNFPTWLVPGLLLLLRFRRLLYIGRRETIMETGGRTQKGGKRKKKSETSNNAISLLVPHEIGPTAAGPDLILLRVARRAQWPIDWKSSGARVRDPMYISRPVSMTTLLGGWLVGCVLSKQQPTNPLVGIGPMHSRVVSMRLISSDRKTYTKTSKDTHTHTHTGE